MYFSIAARDPRVNAVVLEISSPGGTVTASEEIYAQIQAFRAVTQKPVVTFVKDLGASGAYLAACATDRIVAAPATLVGSVGVVMQIMNFTEALAKLGVKAHVLTSGDLKAANSPFTPFDPEAEKRFRTIIMETQQRFLHVVQQNRRAITPQDFTDISRGGIYSASEALKFHLIDEIGYRPSAIEAARHLAGVPDPVPTIVTYQVQRSPFENIIRIAQVLNPTSEVLERLELKAQNQLLYLWDPSLF